MATAAKKTAPAAKTTPATPAAAASDQRALSTEVDFSSDAGAGMEGATAESFAIPFLGILQKGSPQVDEASGAAIEGAKQGMLFENVTGRMFDGKTGVLVVPCAYRRVFVRWAPREAGGGFRGEVTPDIVAAMRGRGEVVELDNRLLVPLPDGTVHEKKCDTLRDTRNHYVVLIDSEGGWTNALVSLVSTQVKKSRMLMSALASVKFRGPAGLYTPPTFANLVRFTTIPESNDKGSWYGARFEIEGVVKDATIYAAAKAFHASVAKGQVEVKYEDAGEPLGPTPADGDPRGAF